MVEETLAVLAASGATAVVAAMATDAWQSARDGVVRLFRREGQDRQEEIQRQLESDNALVAEAGDTGLRPAMARLWQARLGSLLSNDPEAKGELQSLLDELGHGVGDGLRPVVQSIHAEGNGQANGVMFGNLTAYKGTSWQETPPAQGEPRDRESAR
ncbi:hypothetical protein OQI_27950 [Streptomyces pharetrae CZA14]|uniref:Uncharacterized protein n=1 Tax=Streptomyces pharetrae CZA14 TaxID=1144883 RepID=A0ABX3YC77_9ACTN|nr:hypothetical protein OQI_27950 [Streptomyces pharetrae CZA14]